MKWFTKHQARVLSVLISQPEKDFNLSELGEIIGKHPGVFQRGINSLEKQGIIVSRKRGNQRLFKINNNNPFFDDIKNTIEKTVGIKGLLEDLVKSIEGISLALIYGSYAKEEMRADSDIDLLVVVKDDNVEDALLDKIVVIEKKILRDINYKIYSEDEFISKRKEDDPFLEEIISDKYILIKGILVARN